MKKLLCAGILGALIILLSGCTSLFHVPQAVTQLQPSTPGERPPAEARLFSRINGEYVQGQVIVGYEDTAALQSLVAKIGGTVIHDIPQLKVALVQLPSTLDVPQAIGEINIGNYQGTIKNIRYAEPNYCRIIKPIRTDNTSRKWTPKVYDPTKDLRPYQWGLDAVNANGAWTYARGDGMIIAVIDSGVDGGHPDLQGQVIDEWYDAWNMTWINGIDSSWNPLDIIPDYYRPWQGWHGTHVAGIIAARDDNQGTVGLAPRSRILSIRIFSPDVLSHYHNNGYVGDFNVAAGIVAAVDYGANVLSNSWGLLNSWGLSNSWGSDGRYSQTIKEAIDYALVHRVVVVAAMMNTSMNKVAYPAAYPGVIAVGATTPNNKRAGFSTMGGWISVGAPGEGILSCVPRWWKQDGTGDELLYDYWGGTSMATPFVSALAALVLERHPNATPYQIKRIIEDTATDIEAPGFDCDTGYGLINAAGAVARDNLPLDGGYLSVDVQTRNGTHLPDIDIILRKDGIDRYFGNTGWSKVNDFHKKIPGDDAEQGEFYGIDPGIYDVLVGGQNMLPGGRIANRVTANGVVAVEPGERKSLKIEVNTQLQVILKYPSGLDLDLGIEVHPLSKETADHYSYYTTRTGCPYGVFTTSGTAGGEETFTLTNPHVYGIYYLIIDASKIESSIKIAPINITIKENGITESYGPYSLVGGKRYPSYKWPGWWDKLGGVLVY